MHLAIHSFSTRKELHEWLLKNHAVSPGIMIKLFKVSSGITSVSFQEVLEEGLCFGWSESQRLPYDTQAYLQKFTPRKTRGTTSERNRKLVEKLDKLGLMTDAGRSVL